MNIAVFTPYGSHSHESRAAYLFASYLRHEGSDVLQICCNGAFERCDRFRENELKGRREFGKCTSCIADQHFLASSVNIDSVDVSTYMTADMLKEAARLTSSAEAEELFNLEYRDIKVFDICRGSFEARFGKVDGRYSTLQLESLRGLVKVSVAALAVAGAVAADTDADFMIIPGGNDLLSRAFSIRAEACGRQVVLVKAEEKSSSLWAVPLYGNSEGIEVPDNSTHFAGKNYNEWPEDLKKGFEEVCLTLEMIDPQLELPFSA